ncbi:flagellar assembly protein FliW [Ureibacillus sp. FSL K6-8385]|nr:flagellar assembly protein FliW [Ureibacillus terrenus]MED3660921.1 flagellar assembly protein FliW [Ureibacillus terrenus]
MMNIQTAYMGEMTIDPTMILNFEHGIPGFEGEKQFIQLPLGENGAFQILQSVKTKDLAFIITSPYIIKENYDFEIDEATVHALDIRSEEEVAVFVIVTLKDTLAESTANLRAPLVVNTRNKKAKQVILNDEAYAIRHKLDLQSEKG